MDQFLHIRSSKFPILPGEEEELVNDGIYGKALALYLQQQLVERGYDAPFVCCEDWGWWVELKMAPFAYGVCVYRFDQDKEPAEFCCTDAPVGKRKFSWQKFRLIETAPYREKLFADLKSILESDDEIEFLGAKEDFPL